MVEENNIVKHFKLFTTIFITTIIHSINSYAKPSEAGAYLGIPCKYNTSSTNYNNG